MSLNINFSFGEKLLISQKGVVTRYVEILKGQGKVGGGGGG